jgi:hypothetical protein
MQIKDSCFVSDLIILLRPKRYISLVYLNIHRMYMLHEIITQLRSTVYFLYNFPYADLFLKRIKLDLNFAPELNSIDNM